MLPVDTLSALLFSTQAGSQLMTQLNSQLRSLVSNDRALMSESIVSPGIWECKWLNNPSIQGYQKGQAVWMNVHSPQSILNNRRADVLQYIEDNLVLNAMYARIAENSMQDENDFIVKVITGKASSQVSALFCLGNIEDDVQIRVSDINNNKALPTDDAAWHDFYIKSDIDTNASAMMSCLSNMLSSDLSTHVAEYHISALTEDKLSQLGFFKKKPFSTDDIDCQRFFDHSCCERMNGFDYAVSTVYSTNNDGSTSWCRQWKSGYVEQGGIASNDKQKLIEVHFAVPYNYPVRNNFYQDNYNWIDGQNVQGQLTDSHRYVCTVTPIAKNGQPAYSSEPTSIHNVPMYTYVDATAFDNSGFKIVNCDTAKNMYDAYSWHVAGYKTVQ